MRASSINIDEIKRVKYYSAMQAYSLGKFKEAGLDDRDVQEIFKYL